MTLTGFSGVRGVGVRADRAAVHGQPIDLADISQTIDTEDTDIEAIDREEIDTLTEDMADFLQSIID
ncbi:hypothetical protein BDR07DRAFT_1494380 [Suillus spraguei]|nr:hypothetical protein BDR07DRAFT_1494380 [Suillus spraguei]